MSANQIKEFTHQNNHLTTNIDSMPFTLLCPPTQSYYVIHSSWAQLIPILQDQLERP